MIRAAAATTVPTIPNLWSTLNTEFLLHQNGVALFVKSSNRSSTRERASQAYPRFTESGTLSIREDERLKVPRTAAEGAHGVLYAEAITQGPLGGRIGRHGAVLDGAYRPAARSDRRDR